MIVVESALTSSSDLRSASMKSFGQLAPHFAIPAAFFRLFAAPIFASKLRDVARIDASFSIPMTRRVFAALRLFWREKRRRRISRALLPKLGRWDRRSETPWTEMEVIFSLACENK